MADDEEKSTDASQKQLESDDKDADFPERKQDYSRSAQPSGAAMFDVSFPELVLVTVIGLLVLGPQRLPKVAAEIGKWVGRARRTATQLRRQLEREIELSELEKPI